MISRLKKVLSTAGLICAASFGSEPATAGVLTFNGFEYGSATVDIGSIPAPIITTPSAGALLTSINGATPFESFCIDIWQWLGGNDYTFHPSAVGVVTNIGTINQTTVDNLNRLYNEAHASIVNDAINSAAFQVAVWEIVYDTPVGLSLSNGNFFSSGPSAVTGVAAGWLNNLSSYSAGGYVVSAWTSPAQQDVILFTAVPEPATYSLVLLALGLMGFHARRPHQSRDMK